MHRSPGCILPAPRHRLKEDYFLGVLRVCEGGEWAGFGERDLVVENGRNSMRSLLYPNF